MSRITGNREYEQYADKLIDAIVENIDSVKEYIQLLLKMQKSEN
jgi:hypothetical protein